jgi:hypothetical protein
MLVVIITTTPSPTTTSVTHPVCAWPHPPTLQDAAHPTGTPHPALVHADGAQRSSTTDNGGGGGASLAAPGGGGGGGAQPASGSARVQLLGSPLNAGAVQAAVHTAGVGPGSRGVPGSDAFVGSGRTSLVGFSPSPSQSRRGTVDGYVSSSPLQQVRGSPRGSSSAVAAGAAAASARSGEYEVTSVPMPHMEQLLKLGSLVLPVSSERL